MKKCINGLVYDSEKAELVVQTGIHDMYNGFTGTMYKEQLQLKKTKNGRYMEVSIRDGEEYSIEEVNMKRASDWTANIDPGLALELFPDEIKEA